MITTLVLEHVFDRTPDGFVWTGAAFPYSFFARYLAEFSGIRVAARVREVSTPPPDARRADGEYVSFAAIPFYHGLLGYLRTRSEVRAAAAAAVRRDEALILRVASPIAGTMAKAIRAQGHPFAVEVVCDPWEVFSRQGVSHPLRPLIRRHFTAQLRRQCLACCAGAYVTERALQHRYPVRPGIPSFGVSDVELPPDAFVSAPRPVTAGPFTMVMVGSLAQLYKGPDVLVDAAAYAVTQGLDLKVHIIGDGRFRTLIEQRIQQHGLTERVRLLGQLPAGGAVRAELDRADAFVLPSRTEGLPRALVEAMARGLPCLASAVGGIPELLPSDCLVPPGDAQALGKAIVALGRDLPRRQALAQRNLERARDFADAVLAERRAAFCRAVRDATAAWQATGTV